MIEYGKRFFNPRFYKESLIVQQILLVEANTSSIRLLISVIRSDFLYRISIFMTTLCNTAGHIHFHPVVSFFFSSPNLSGRRLDVYHTSTHGVALV